MAGLFSKINTTSGETSAVPSKPMTKESAETAGITSSGNSAPSLAAFANAAGLAALNATVQEEPTAQVGGKAISGLNDLASLDTSKGGLEATEKRLTEDELSVRKLDAETLLQGPAGVRELLGEVDRLTVSDEKAVSPMHLPFLRDYVRQLMVTLKTHAEYESIFLDKDIRNIVTVMRMLQHEAVGVLEARKTKKVTRDAKKEAKADSTAGKVKSALDKLDLGDFAAAFGMTPKGK